MITRMNKGMKKRCLLLTAVMLIAAVVVVVRLVILQIFSYEEYQKAAVDNIQRETTVAAERGIIYDRNMVQLASNRTVWRVFISPQDIIDKAPDKRELIARRLSEILDADYDDIYERAGRVGRLDETVKRNVDEATANEVLAFIAEYGLEDQIHLQAGTMRYYPYGTLASNVIGCVGTDGGLFGLEMQYDSYLSGTPGRYVTAKNAKGYNMPFKYDSYINASNGLNVVSTIDLTIQNLLEEQVRQSYEDTDPLNRVTGIVMNPQTGEIYGMATYPTVDLNDPYTLDERYTEMLALSGLEKGTDEYREQFFTYVYSLWKNKAVSELYEPGSTFKILTTAMAREEKVTSFTEKYTCLGYLHIDGYSQPIHCHKHSGHGTLSYAEGLQQSCNPILMQVAAKIGKNAFHDYFVDFGYTEKTGIDLPGEAGSIYHNIESFNQVELAVYSFGQTFKVTPLQQLTAICTIANGGYLVTPHVVSALVDDNENTVTSFGTEVKRQVVSTEICQEISKVLEEGVSGNGGAKNAYVAGYKIAAKTGTSEVRDVLNEDGQSYLRVGSCVAYAPYDDPVVAVIIVCDQPQNGSVYGSITAAPYVANLMDQILPYLGVERQYTERDKASLTVTVGDYGGWDMDSAIKAATNSLGVKYEIVGSGTYVVKQIPEAGSTMIKENGKIVFYTDSAAPKTVKVPDLLGQTGVVANRTLVNGGFNIKITGTTNYAMGSGAVVVSQYPAAGSEVEQGSVITIELMYMDGTAN